MSLYIDMQYNQSANTTAPATCCWPYCEATAQFAIKFDDTGQVEDYCQGHKERIEEEHGDAIAEVLNP